MPSVILPCTCKHVFQDERYGPQQRVHTTCDKGVRCTVCANFTTKGVDPTSKEKTK